MRMTCTAFPRNIYYRIIYIPDKSEINLLYLAEKMVASQERAERVSLPRFGKYALPAGFLVSKRASFPLCAAFFFQPSEYTQGFVALMRRH